MCCSRRRPATKKISRQRCDGAAADAVAASPALLLCCCLLPSHAPRAAPTLLVLRACPAPPRLASHAGFNWHQQATTMWHVRATTTTQKKLRKANCHTTVLSQRKNGKNNKNGQHKTKQMKNSQIQTLVISTKRPKVMTHTTHTTCTDALSSCHLARTVARTVAGTHCAIVCQPASQRASEPASQPASHGLARVRRPPRVRTRVCTPLLECHGTRTRYVCTYMCTYRRDVTQLVPWYGIRVDVHSRTGSASLLVPWYCNR